MPQFDVKVNRTQKTVRIWTHSRNYAIYSALVLNKEESGISHLDDDRNIIKSNGLIMSESEINELVTIEVKDA